MLMGVMMFFDGGLLAIGNVSIFLLSVFWECHPTGKTDGWKGTNGGGKVEEGGGGKIRLEENKRLNNG